MRKGGQRGEIVLGHPDQLIGLTITGDLHPVIFEQLELDFLIREQSNKLEQLFCRDGAGALFFHLGFARRADAELEVRRGDVEAITLGLAEKIREDRDRGLALDNPLR